MRRRVLGWGLLLTLTWPGFSDGALPVIDTASIGQLVVQIENQVKQYTAMLKSLEQQYTQIQHQIRQIEHLYTTVQQGVRNLTQLDLNNAADLFGMVRQLENKLSQAKYIGYQVNNAVHQAEQYYPILDAMTDLDGKRVLEMQWASMKRASGMAAIATQALEERQKTYSEKWQALLNKARAAEGNLQAQQAGVQAQGLVGNQLLTIEQLIATQARMMSEKNLEEASRTMLEHTAIQHVTQEVNTNYKAQGRVLQMMRTGRE